MQRALAHAIDPRAYILGKGVERDYRVATRMYGERCGEGCGELAPCRSYLELAMRSRGTVPTLEHMKLAARLCDRGHRFGCMVAVVAGLRDRSALEGYVARG